MIAPRDSARPGTIRSFIRRQGRLTEGQRRALVQLWPTYGLAFENRPLDLDRVFGRSAPRILEIGFGNGDTLLALAQAHPECDYLGVEVHRPGVGHLLLGLERLRLTNVRVISHDAVEVLAIQIPDNSLQEILLYFPDPWPKKRHHKRRILQPAFVELVARRLAPGGILRMATDWEDYAEHMLAVMKASARFARDTLQAQSGNRPLTRFERRGRRLGHEVHEFAWRLLPEA